MRLKYTDLPIKLQLKVDKGYELERKIEIAEANEKLKETGLKWDDRVDILSKQFNWSRPTIRKHLADYNRDIKKYLKK